MKQLGLSLHNYHDVHLTFPPGVVWSDGPYTGSRQSYLIFLLPYLDQAPLYNLIDFNVAVGWFRGANGTATAAYVPGFRCPSDPGPNYQSYTASTWNQKWFLTNYM